MFIIPGILFLIAYLVSKIVEMDFPIYTSLKNSCMISIIITHSVIIKQAEKLLRYGGRGKSKINRKGMKAKMLCVCVVKR